MILSLLAPFAIAAEPASDAGAPSLQDSGVVVQTRVAPKYPDAARDGRFGPVVVCQVTVEIDASGAPYAVVPGSCPEDFVEPTTTAMLQWRFEPPAASGARFSLDVEYVLYETGFRDGTCIVPLEMAANGMVGRLGGQRTEECPVQLGMGTRPSEWPEGGPYGFHCFATLTATENQGSLDIEVSQCPPGIADVVKSSLENFKFGAWHTRKTPYELHIQVDPPYRKLEQAEEQVQLHDSPDFPGFHYSQMVVTKRVQPEYPYAALEKGIKSATCMAEIRTDAAGKPIQARVRDCDAEFADATHRALMQWEWQPPLVGGQASAAEFTLPIHFAVVEEAPKPVPVPVDASAPTFRRRSPEPQYPNDAWLVKMGKRACSVHVIVDDQGVPYDVLPDDCPWPLYEETRDSVMKWRAEPVVGADGQATAARFPLEIPFDRPLSTNGGECGVGLLVGEGGKADVVHATGAGGCGFHPADPLPLAGRYLCGARVTVGPEGVQGVTTDHCPDTVGDGLEKALATWRYTTVGERRTVYRFVVSAP